MSSQPAQAAQPTTPGQPGVDAHGYHGVLHDLIGMGANLARALHDTAIVPAGATPAGAAPRPAAPAPEPGTLIALAAAFDRMARTVRRCIALSRVLSRPVQPAQDPARHRAQARKRILRDVEDTIQREAHEGRHAEALQAELRERLDAPDLEWDLASRPVADIVTEICRDLGLAAAAGTHPWKRRTPQDLADLQARAAAPAAAGHPGAQPGAVQPAHGTPQHPPSPATPAATLRSHPGPDGPHGPADAALLRQPINPRDRWRPLPGA